MHMPRRVPNAGKFQKYYEKQIRNPLHEAVCQTKENLTTARQFIQRKIVKTTRIQIWVEILVKL